MPSKRIKCISCSKLLVPWGKTSSGKKRFRCRYCGASRIFRKENSSKDNHFTLFKQYVLWGLTYEMLSSYSGYSIRYLEEIFHSYLKQDLPSIAPLSQSKMEVAFLLIDGLWFGRWFVLMVYRQSKNLTILHISVCGKEVSTKISKDLKVLKKHYHFTGIVSDGKTGIRKAILNVFGHIPHQICMAHLHRDAVNAMGRYPKDERVRKLKKLADHIWFIESKEALSWWSNKLQEWIDKNREYLHERRYDDQGNWWFIHKGTRKAVRTLVSLPDTSFKFLDHPLMPKTTNELEASFGHLAKRWLIHRGLKKERWEKFMKWFVYFYNQDKQSSSKSRKV